MESSKLLKPWSHGPFHSKNRVFMAPMTRSRAPENIPTELMATYYSQRASAGLIFTEGAQLAAGTEPLLPRLRGAFSGLLLANNGYTKRTAEAVLDSGKADAVSFGTLFISNPDLPERFAQNAPLIEPDRSTFYGGGAKGYTDYASL